MADEFVLLDNTYCCGILSADGHQWSTTAFSTDYMEKSFAGFPRSYPDGMGVDENDALAYSPAGFIWDNALEAQARRSATTASSWRPHVRWRDPAQGRHARLRSLLPRVEEQDGRRRVRVLAVASRRMRAFSPHGLRRLGDVGARPVSRRLHAQGARASSKRRASFPTS